MNDRHKQWAEQVKKWRASGMTSEEFGPTVGVTGRCIRRWAQKLGAGTQKPTRRARRARLMRVEVVAASTQEQAVVVHVAGRRVEVKSGFSKATLAAVLEVVEALR